MRRQWCLGAIVLLATAVPSWAIVFSSVSGVVQDPQGHPVPGVVVTLKARASDLAQSTVTDADGRFGLAAVPIGEYTASA